MEHSLLPSYLLICDRFEGKYPLSLERLESNPSWICLTDHIFQGLLHWSLQFAHILELWWTVGGTALLLGFCQYQLKHKNYVVLLAHGTEPLLFLQPHVCTMWTTSPISSPAELLPSKCSSRQYLSIWLLLSTWPRSCIDWISSSLFTLLLIGSRCLFSLSLLAGPPPHLTLES